MSVFKSAYSYLDGEGAVLSLEEDAYFCSPWHDEKNLKCRWADLKNTT